MVRRRGVAVARARRPSGGRSIAVFLTAFAFLLQSVIVQSHIHGAALSNAGLGGLIAKISASDEDAPLSKAPGKQAPKNDESRCPFCQAAQSAGSFVAPAAIALVLPWQNVSLVPLFFTSGTRVDAASHDWRGRAPPHA
jgi:hypothetical protein